MNMVERKIKLLAKLLKEEDERNNQMCKIFYEFYSIIKEGFIPKLEKSTFPNKTKIFSLIEGYLEDIELLINFSDIIGNSFIGVLGSDYDTYNTIINNLIIDKGKNLHMSNSNIPSIILNNDDNIIKLLNLLDNEVILTEEEYNLTTKELYKNRIDIREFIKVFQFNEKLLLNYCGISFLPDYALRMSKYYKKLAQYTNVMYIYANDKNNWRYNLKYLKQIAYKNDICIFTENEYMNEVNEYKKELSNMSKQVIVYDINNNIYEITKKYDYNTNNIRIKDKLLWILNQVKLYYFHLINKEKLNLNSINKDLINIEDDVTEERIREKKKEIINSLNKEETVYKQIKEESNILLHKCDDLDKIISKLYDNKNIINKSSILELLWVQIVLQMIEMEDFDGFKQYIEKLESIQFKYSFILRMLFNSKMKLGIDYNNINMLKNINDDHYLIYKAKIAFRAQLGLTYEKCGEIFLKLPKKYVDKDYEYYVAGRYFEKIHYKKAIKFYYNALELGNMEAGDRLLDLAEKDNEINIEYLAQNMVPRANLKVGLNAINDNRYAKGITHIKIAAALKNLDAIKYLADLQYNKIIKNYKYRYKSDNFNEECKKLLQLYFYILSIRKEEQSVLESIGFTYYAVEDYRKALEFLLKCKSQYALYMCGRIYQYGKGTIPQDIYKARDLLNESAKLGNQKARVEYQKVCGWIEANEYKKRVRASTDYSTTSSYSYESSSGGLCFITTATCVALNKQDNCEELLAFKHYRDTTLINDSDGEELIREYYRIAPRIVEAIEEEVNPITVYKQIWKRFISIGYKYLLMNDLVNAKKTYIDMVVHLCEKYEIKI